MKLYKGGSNNSTSSYTCLGQDDNKFDITI